MDDALQHNHKIQDSYRKLAIFIAGNVVYCSRKTIKEGSVKNDFVSIRGNVRYQYVYLCYFY